MSKQRITFPENSVPFFQDFSLWKNIPTNISFRVERLRQDAFKLTGEGYGEPGHYGNGSLFVYRKDLPKELDSRLMRLTRQQAMEGDGDE